MSKLSFSALLAGAAIVVAVTGSSASARTVPSCAIGSGLTCSVDKNSVFAALSPGKSANDNEASVEAAVSAALGSLKKIDLTLLGKSDDGYGSGAVGGDKSGTFTTLGKVSYFTVKAGQGFLIFDGKGLTSSSWNTLGLFVGKKNNQPDLSHISYWSDPSVSTVPLPAAAWMLLAAIGGLAALKRRTTI